MFRTFLPAKGKTNGHRAEALIDTDHADAARYQVRSRALILADDSELLRIMLWFRDVGYGEFVLTDIGDIVALEFADRQVDAWTATKAVLDVKGYELVEDNFRTLFSPYWSQQQGTRRSARIYDGHEEDEATYQVSAKAVTANNEADEFIQLRIWNARPRLDRGHPQRRRRHRCPHGRCDREGRLEGGTGGLPTQGLRHRRLIVAPGRRRRSRRPG